MNKNIHLSVIIPAYNEKDRIVPTLRLTSEWLRKQDFSYEIIVVNDGSIDNTAKVVSALFQELPFLRLVDNSPNRGKGYVVPSGHVRSARKFAFIYGCR